jgi:hypothetical protein
MSPLDLDELAEVIGQVIAHERDKWGDEVEVLKQRISALEERPAMTYEGVWAGGREYAKGTFVTHAGSVWCCTTPTTQRPGGGEKSWRLAVKHGQARNRKT